MKKSIILLLASILIIVLFGCHSSGGGGSSPFPTSDNTDRIITSKKMIVKENGRFQDIILPSGTLIKCPEDDTLHEGAVVTVTEEKNSAEKVESGMPLYIYRISAVLHSSNNLAEDIIAATIKKPLTVSIPNDTNSGLCYAGIRTDSEDSWRFFFITDSNIDKSNILSMRFSQNSPNPCTFNLYRLGVEFALFVFKNEGEINSDIEVDALIPPEKTIVQIKDKKYAEDLKVKFTLKGLNLGSLIDNNLKVRITYRSSKATPSDFKVNSLQIKQETFYDKAVSGLYAHSFIVPSLKINSAMNNEAVVSFIVNLKEISLEDFPKEYIVEIYSIDSSNNIKPFIYTQTFGFETEEKEDVPEKPEQPENPDQPEQTIESYKITYELNGGYLTSANPTSYDITSSTITLNNPIKNGYVFKGWSGTGLTGDENISVSIPQGSKGDRSYTANWLKYAVLSLKSASTGFQLDGNIQLEFDREVIWLDSYKDNISITPAITISSCSLNGRVLTLVLSDNLEYDTSYTLSVSGIEGVEDKNFTIKTIAKAVVNLESNADSFVSSDTIKLEFDHEIDWQDSYKNCITITPTTPTSPNLTINSCSYSNKQLSIKLSDKLKYDTSYNIGINGLEGVADYNLALNIAPLIVVPEILPAESSIDKTRNNHCILRPEFSIDFGKKLLNTNNIINKIQLNDAALPNSCTLVFEENGRIASLTFTEDIEQFTDYRLSLISFKDDDNSSISASEFSFKTIPSDEFRGSGTLDDPYLIYTEAHLNKLRETTPNNYLGGNFYYKQMDDIVLTSDWVPIGDNTNKFIGNYNGNDKTISNLRIPYEYNENPSPNTRYVGLFGYNNGTISRVNVNNVFISIDSDFFYYTGCLVGTNYGLIEYCSVSSASVTIHSDCSIWLGGICGSNYGSVGSCSLEFAKLDCFSSDYDGSIYIGGIVAYHNPGNKIESCNVTDIDIRGSATGILSRNYIGGICGYDSTNSCIITKCKVSSSGNHKIIGSAEGHCYVGGIIGFLGSYNISMCSVTGYELTGYSERECCVGGLFGQKDFFYTDISKSYVDNCVITGTGNNNYVGGLCGNILGQLVSCYVSNTSVRGLGDINCIGGLCGYIKNKCSISGCYVYEDSSHDISGPNSGYLVGLLYGETSNQSNNTTISDSFFNKETTNLVNRVGDLTTNNTPEEGYANIENCYDSIDSFDNYQTLQWSDGKTYSDSDSVWKDYNISANLWPPDLKELPRGN